VQESKLVLGHTSWEEAKKLGGSWVRSGSNSYSASSLVNA
jgi:hypothetical protein